MAQQFIKIFDDTVLKQSVNQGFEVQRTNSRLGKFTMGELAFTRDTARLFVGNYTNLNEDKDSQQVIGGSLVGNKYLGFIDSKPLTHWRNQASSNNHLPLSYTTDDTATSAAYSDLTEKAILLKGSKYRTDKNGGWPKNAAYNHVYDAYDGDYVYDAYNNALILFDHNIKLSDIITDDYNWKCTKNKQQFEKNDGDYWEETNGNYSTNRTLINNPKNPTGNTQLLLGNPEYPIYGDGYVVMRILEPDGLTLGYVEKNFDQATGEAVNNNYSHNYIEIKNIPTNVLIDSFDSGQFQVSGTKISLKSSALSSGSFSEISSANDDNSLVLPKLIKFRQSIAGTLDINFSKANATSSEFDKIICVTESDNQYTTKFLQPPSLSITINGQKSDAVKLLPGNINEITIGNSGESTSSSFYKIFSPFRTSSAIQPTNGNYWYSGSDTYNSSGLVSSECIIDVDTTKQSTFDDWYSYFVLYDSSGDINYSISTVEKQDDNGNTVTIVEAETQFEHPYLNQGHNLIKTPEPIAWGTSGNFKGQFFLYPFIVSPKAYNSGDGGCIGKVGVEGDGLSLDPYKPNNDDFIDIDIKSEASVIGVIIPDHAKTLICELTTGVTTNTQSKYCLSTASEYDAYETIPTYSDADSSISLSTISNSSIPVFNSNLSKYKILYNKSISSNEKTIIEIPLYRDANRMKFFSFAMGATGPWVLRAIGYKS